MAKIAAIKAEAQSSKVPFEYRGEKYEIDTDFDLEVLENLEDGQVVKAVKGLLGDEQYAKFRATKPKMSDLNELMTAAFAATRVSLGESTA